MELHRTHSIAFFLSFKEGTREKEKKEEEKKKKKVEEESSKWAINW